MSLVDQESLGLRGLRREVSVNGHSLALCKEAENMYALGPNNFRIVGLEVFWCKALIHRLFDYILRSKYDVTCG